MPTTEATDNRLTSNTDARIRAGGVWLAIGALLLVGGFVLHPLPSPDPAEFVATIADAPTRWVAAHVTTAIGLSVVAIAALIVLTADSRLTRTWWTTTAWAALIVSALLVTTAAVVEATVIAEAAIGGDTATFEAWSVFADVHSAAFLFFALAIAVIAGNEARSAPQTTPAWASWIGAVAGVAAFGGMVLVFVLGIAPGGPVWIGSTIVMSLWTAWFGVVLARSEADAWIVSEEPRAGGQETVH
ncbi:hypothetical protein [Halosolutus halophilus]|uniref:hypothetical protein n=1 Tax=Halosolutus halophilus TaxID=1552990 RepID=UPI00223507F2|nr:hypothetical protein [Halosolutus halophilus]